MTDSLTPHAGALLRSTLGVLPHIAVFCFDAELRYTAVLGVAGARFGWTPEAVLGRRAADLIPIPHWSKLEPAYAAALRGETTQLELESIDGTTLFHAQIGPDGEGGGTAIIIDRTQERADATREEEVAQRFERAFADAPIGMALVGLDGAWLRVNAALVTLLGYPEPELLTKTFQDITHPDDLEADLADLERLTAGEIANYAMEKRYLTATGALVWVLLSVSLVRYADGQPHYFVSQIVDITARKRTEADLEHIASHDALTGLFNRRRFEAEVERQVARTRRYGEAAALLLIDLDGFKYVNDTFGHRVGDDLLRHLAATVSARLRTTDTFGRLSGDEFAIVLTNVSAEQALETASDIAAVVAATPLAVQSEPLHATVSIGVAPLTEQDTSESAFIEADIALYDAKERGRNRAAAADSDSERRDRITSSLRWSQRLRHALADDGFALHAQPIVDLRTGTATMHELLLRLPEDDGTLIGPETFLYIAERFGYARELDRWVIARAVELAAEFTGATLAVNLFGRSVTDTGLGDYVEAQLERTGCRPEQLVFEVTETEAIANMEQARVLGRRLQRLGSRFALDDFGRGFASFYHLKTLPLDLLKIDGEFVRELADEGIDAMVIDAVRRVADHMGKGVIAEHVEDARSAEILRGLGVELAQGFHFAAPVPAREALKAPGT